MFKKLKKAIKWLFCRDKEINVFQIYTLVGCDDDEWILTDYKKFCNRLDKQIKKERKN